jgi:hypothetical protein
MLANVLGNGGIGMRVAMVAIKELANFVPCQTAGGGEGVFVDGSDKGEGLNRSKLLPSNLWLWRKRTQEPIGDRRLKRG